MLSSTSGVYDLESSQLREAHLGLAYGTSTTQVSRLAAERSALLQAVAERSSESGPRRSRPLAWRRVVAALTKPA